MSEISHPRPILTKIPGDLPKRLPEQHIENLSKLSKIQLLEIKERQEKLLANKSQTSKLPDKGKRIQNFYDKIIQELSHRDEVEKAAKLFSDLNIASSGHRKLTDLEWTGQYDSNRGEYILDSDDEEETDLLKILAQSTNHEKKIKCIPPDKLLITEEDLKEIEDFKKEDGFDKASIGGNTEESIVPAEIVNIDVKSKVHVIKPKLEELLNTSKTSSTSSIDLDPHVLYLFDKGVNELPQKEKFKPYKTTKSNVHDPEKEKLRKPLGKYWEVTAATPPPIQHAGAKVLSLQDSVEIQVDYLAKLKKLQEQQAVERLKAKDVRLKSMGISLPEKSVIKLNQSFRTYRSTLDNDILSDSEMEEQKIDSEEEVRDDEEEKGGVNYIVYK